MTSIGNYAFSGCFFLYSSFINNSTLTDSNNWGATLFDEETEDGLLIKDNNVIKCRSWAISVTIPNSVTSIGKKAFYECSGLTSVTIPNSVTSIGNRAFQYCSGLTSITIPNSVKSIGSSAFEYCSGLTSVHISELEAWLKISFTGYDSNPLYYAHHLYLDGNEITNLVIPNSVTSIRNFTFYGCSGLTSVTIPNSVKSIGEYAFSGCRGLTTVRAYATKPPLLSASAFSDSEQQLLLVPYSSKDAYEAADGWNKFGEIEEFYLAGTILTAMTPQAIEMQFCVVDDVESTFETYAKQNGEEFVAAIDKTIEGSLIIPGEIEGYRVVGIGSSSFRECIGITSVSLPAGITYIGESAFRMATSLKAVNIPEGVEALLANTFDGCPLTTVILPSTLKRITGEYVFRYSNVNKEGAACSFIANMAEPCALDEGSIYGMEYYDLYVPRGSKEAYQSHAQWSRFRSIREIGEVDEDVKAEVKADDLTMKAGERAKLTVSLTTERNDYTGYQFNLYLPEGISVATDNYDNYLVKEKTGRRKIVLEESDGSVLFNTIANSDLDELATGRLMEIELTASTALAAGKYTVRIERIVFSTTDKRSLTLPPATFTVTVEKASETETQGVVTADDVEGEPDSQVKMPVFLNNATDINAFYFDLTLPKGVTVAETEDGNILASLTGDYADGKMLLTAQPWDASMGTTNNVNTWRFIATPIDDNVFRANAGRVMTITLDVDKDMAGGVYTARMNVVKLVEVSGSRVDNRLRSVASVSSAPSASWTSYSTITMRTNQHGDVNGDFTIDVADIATVIDVMASGSGIATPLQQAADVNKDGTVDVADIATIIDIMAANARRQRMMEE